MKGLRELSRSFLQRAGGVREDVLALDRCCTNIAFLERSFIYCLGPALACLGPPSSVFIFLVLN